MAHVIGDWAYSLGGAGAVLEKGTHVMIYVKRGGQWQALVDISHTTPPAK